MVNEPLNALDGTPVNACLVEWPDAKDVHEFLRGKVLCIAIHATRDIDAGEEIFVHYGRDYDRRGYGSALDRLGHATTVSKKVIRAAGRPPTTSCATCSARRRVPRVLLSRRPKTRPRPSSRI